MIELYISRPCHNIDIAVRTNSIDLSQHIKAYYDPFISLTPQHTTAEIEVLVDNDGIWIRTQKQRYKTDHALQSVINFVYENISINDDMFAMHAAAIEYQGQAYVLAGATGSGKTTLTTYLTSKGFGYITDDCTLISRNTFAITPYLCKIHLRAGGMEVLKSQCIPVESIFFKHSAEARYLYTPQKQMQEPLPLKAILWLNRTKDQNDTQSISSGELMRLLMESAISQNKLSGEHLRFLSRLSSIVCQKVRYQDMGYVEQVIRGIAEC